VKIWLPRSFLPVPVDEGGVASQELAHGANLALRGEAASRARLRGSGLVDVVNEHGLRRREPCAPVPGMKVQLSPRQSKKTVVSDQTIDYRRWIARTLSARPLLSRSRLSSFLVPAIMLVVAGLIWWALARPSIVAPYILPSPQSVLHAATGDERATLLDGMAVTVREIGLGFCLACLMGFLAGTMLVHLPRMSRAVYPFLIASQAVPVLAVAPLLVIWFGFGVFPKILVVILFAFFPVAINTMTGMSAVERDTFLLMRSLGADRWDVLRWVRLPAALPRIFVGVKLAAIASVIGAVVGEWVGASGGIGVVMISANSTLSTNVEFAAIAYLSLVSLILYALVAIVERLAMKWYFLSIRTPTQ
jgi:ABC-type nitrate/sulfonate/bicarbonate transport system permease component